MDRRHISSSHPFTKEFCRWRATKAGDLLSRRMMTIKMIKGGKFDVMQYVAPFTNVIKNRVFQCICIAIGIAQLSIFCNAMAGIQNYGDYSFQKLKFEWSQPETSDSVSLSLLLRGCEIYSGNLSKSNRSIIVFDHVVHIDGFGLTFNEKIDGPEKIMFSLHGAADTNSTNYYLVGSSDLRFSKRTVRFLDAPVPMRQKMVYQYHPPWPWYMTEFMVTIVWALVCLCTGMCGAFNAPIAAKRIALWGSCCLSLINVICGIGYITLGLTREAFSSWINVLLYTTAPAILKFKEVYFTDACAVLGIFSIITRIVGECIVFQDCPFLLVDPPVSGFGFAVLGVISIVQRHRFFAKTVKNVQHDKAAFDAVWLQLIATDRDALDNMDITAKKFALSCLPAKARQFNRERLTCSSSTSSVTQMVSRVFQTTADESSADLFSCKSIPGSRDESNPITSLDQLYAQSLAVLPILHSHSSRWAESSGGTLDHDARLLAEPHPDLPATANRWRQHRYLKCPSRAIEKVLTCYGGDVSRLVDICRTRIAFDCPADMLGCLALICRRSPSVCVMRIKNGLDPAIISDASGGFRALIVNIRFDNLEARHLGVEGHICEVQLVTKSFVRLLDDNVHARYLYLRAVRQYARWHKSGQKPSTSNRIAPVDSAYVAGPDIGHAIEVVVSVGAGVPSSGPFPGVRDSPQAVPLDSLPAVSPEVTRRVSLSVAWDRPINDWLESIALHVYQRCSVHAGNVLDQKASEIDKAFHQSSTSSVVFTSKPLAAMASKRIFKAIFIFVSVYSTWRFILAILAMAHMKYYAADQIRLTVYQGRIGERMISTSNTAEYIMAGLYFGLLQNGCGSGQYLVLNLNALRSPSFDPPSSKWNGYFYSLPALSNSSSSQLMPEAWLLEGTVDNGSTWYTLGASVWRFDSSGSPDFYPKLTHRTADLAAKNMFLGLPNGARLDVDMRLPLSWMIGSMTEKLLFAVGFMFISLATFSGRATWVKGIWIFMVVLDAVLLTICSAVIMTSEPWMWREAVNALLYVAWQFFLAVGTIADESRFILTLTVYSFVSLVSAAVAEVILYDHQWLQAIQGVLPSLPFVGLCFGIVVFWSRRRTLKSAHRVIMADKQRYDDIWALCQSDDRAQAAILSVHEIVNRLLREQPLKTVLRQFNKVENTQQSMQHSSGQSHEAEELSQRGIKTILSTLDLNHPVDSLDQLFVQAWCLNPILQNKCMAWAWESNGLFPCKLYSGIKFIRYADVVNVPGLPIKWTSVKSIHRAIEKLVRAYSQDVSRLLDLCRQSIVFESIEDLATCLRALEADPDVHILRIKNRLDPNYNSLITAGYRDVELNMLINNVATVDLGINTHICEIQLILEPFAELKSDEGHARYVAFRNLRGE